MEKKRPLFAEMGMSFFFGIAAIASKMGQSERLMQMITRQIQSPARKRKAFANYQPGAHDVFICTYAKSGTNWAMQIAQQIAYYGEAEFEHIHDLIPWPDIPMPIPIVRLDDSRAWQLAPTNLRVIKTHLESEYVPYSLPAKYILVLRDPKDVFVSSFYFGQGLINRVGLAYDVAGWLAQFMSDHFFFDSWAAHTASFWPWRSRDNVLLLTFREMKNDLRGACQRMADLMQVTLTAEQLDLVVEKSSFGYMQSISHKFMLELPAFGEAQRPVLMRKGKSGAAGELLNKDQPGQIDAFCQSELKRLGSDFPYQSLFANTQISSLEIDEVAD